MNRQQSNDDEELPKLKKLEQYILQRYEHFLEEKRKAEVALLQDANGLSYRTVHERKASIAGFEKNLSQLAKQFETETRIPITRYI